MKKPTPILWLALPVLLFSVVMLARMWSSGNGLPMRDFIEYYSAGLAFADGRNPYDPHLMFELQRAILPSVTEPTMMWNPPWALVIAAPLGLLPPAASHLVWLVLQLAAVLTSVAMLMAVHEVPKPQWIIGIIVALTFAPLALLLWYGQIGGFCLLGLSGFLFFQTRGRPLTAGAFAALTALKPHLLFAFGLMLLLDALVSGRGRRALLGGVLAIAGASMLAWLMNPMVYAYYADSIAAPHSDVHRSVRDWVQPNLSYLLRIAANDASLPEVRDHFYLQFVPTGMATLILLGLWLRTRQPLDWPRQLPRLVFVSVLCVSYGAWLFDLVVLLVPVIQAMAWHLQTWDRRKVSVVAVVVVHAILNCVTTVAPIVAVSYFIQGLGIDRFIYFAPATLLLYLLTGLIARRDS